MHFRVVTKQVEIMSNGSYSTLYFPRLFIINFIITYLLSITSSCRTFIRDRTQYNGVLERYIQLLTNLYPSFESIKSQVWTY